MANDLALTMVKCPDWESEFESAIKEMVEDGFSRIDARRLVGYREGEYITLCSELRQKLGIETGAEVTVGAVAPPPSPAPAVVRGSMLAVPPDAEHEERITDAWLLQLGARFPQVKRRLSRSFPSGNVYPHASPCTAPARCDVD